MTRSAKRRRSELAKIHIGAKQLFGDDREAYEDMLEEVTGKRSSAGLDQAGRRAVIEHLKSCGAKYRPARKSGLKRNPPEPPPETARQIRKIRAMLADDGLPDSYAEAILQRMCSHSHRVPLQWATGKQLGNVIAALNYRKKRIRKRAAAKGGSGRKGERRPRAKAKVAGSGAGPGPELSPNGEMPPAA
ncbi:MAG: regulatory protein GemA [Bryobacterales bacterium]|nr:regulatory protein GemA [Bryobacterales bacterium]